MMLNYVPMMMTGCAVGSRDHDEDEGADNDDDDDDDDDDCCKFSKTTTTTLQNLVGRIRTFWV